MTDKEKILVEKIVSALLEIRKEYNITDEMTQDNGKIYYCNGNDGTNFDWNVNYRTCEIGYGTPNGDCWVVKAYVLKNGIFEAYIYPHGESSPVATKSIVLFSSKEALRFKNLLFKKSDKSKNFDSTFDVLFGI